MSASAAWYRDWGYRQQITINTNKVSGTLTNFPVLIVLTNAPSGLWSHAQANGYDILFTSDDATNKLGHEIESYDAASSQLWAWVKIPTLSDSLASDTNIYMYYGKSGASDQSEATNVWADNYVGVWHLKENPTNVAPQMLDSTSYTNHGTCQASMTNDDQVAGQVNGSLEFDATDDHVTVPDNDSLNMGTSDFTVSAWINASVVNQQALIAKRGSAAPAKPGWIVRTTASQVEDVFLSICDANSNQFSILSLSKVTDDTWRHVAFVVDRDSDANSKVYVDGTDDTKPPGGSVTNVGSINVSRDVCIGDRTDLGRRWDGMIDEVRVSKGIARSEGWIKTSYGNQDDPGTFLTFGPEEEAPHGTVILIR